MKRHEHDCIPTTGGCDAFTPQAFTEHELLPAVHAARPDHLRKMCAPDIVWVALPGRAALRVAVQPARLPGRAKRALRWELGLPLRRGYAAHPSVDVDDALHLRLVRVPVTTSNLTKKIHTSLAQLVDCLCTYAISGMRFGKKVLMIV